MKVSPKNSAKNPIDETQIIQIGKVIEPRALLGELKIFLAAGEASWISKAKELVLEIHGAKTAYKITSARISPQGLIVKLVGINDRTQAERVKGAFVYISSRLMESKVGEKFFLKEILGFSVLSITSNGQNEIETVIGTVKSFESNGSQDLLVVGVPDKNDILIPLVKDFIVKIDNKNKIVLMRLPEGLIEVNT